MIELTYFVALEAEDTLDDLMIECDNIFINSELVEMNTLKVDITTDDENIDVINDKLKDYIVEQRY